QQRETVTVFVGQSRYQLEPIADVLAKTNQALGTLETYRTRLEQVLTRLTALEFQNAVMLDDVLVTLQRAELTTRMAEEIERACVRTSRACRTRSSSASSRRSSVSKGSSAPHSASSRRSRASAPSALARSGRACAACRSTT